jgi:amino acid transporter
MEAATPGAGRPAAVTIAADRSPLKRGITKRLLVFFVIGDILGGGIYALVGEVGGAVGGAIWAAFMLALILAAFTAGSYVELVTKYPHAGGSGLYARRAFRRAPFLAFIVAFAVMCSGITSAGTLSRAFGGDYFAEFVDVPLLLVALIFIVIVAVINYIGISESVRLNFLFTLIELGGLLLIIVIGIVALTSGQAEPAQAFEFKEGLSVPLAILAGGAIAFYALIGFEDSVNVAEEVQEPRTSYPLAIFGGLFVAGIVYFLVAFTAGMVVDVKTLAGSDGPLLEVVKQGPLAIDTRIFSAIGLFALANGALINMIMASRLLYGMARERIVPSIFDRVDENRRTPVPAIIFTTILAMALISTGDLGDLADVTVALLLGVFIVVNIAVLRLRSEPVAHDHFRVPTALPVIGILVSAGVLTQTAPETFLRAAALLGLGVVLYLIQRVVSGEPPPPSDAIGVAAEPRP